MSKGYIEHVLRLHAAGFDATQIEEILNEGAAADEQEARADSLAAEDFEDRAHGDDFSVELGSRSYRLNDGGEPIGYM